MGTLSTCVFDLRRFPSRGVLTNSIAKRLARGHKPAFLQLPHAPEPAPSANRHKAQPVPTTDTSTEPACARTCPIVSPACAAAFGIPSLASPALCSSASRDLSRTLAP